jgi:SAM-dependent methyltransferase
MQHDRLSVEELAALPQKTKKHPETVALYLEHDFLKAYALHTDQRVDLSPEGAIGSHLEWESHGDWQKSFLIEQGLRPEHRFLEIGSGTGRLARKIVPYLDDGNYTGVEISDKARDYSVNLGINEGWLLDKNASFRSSVGVSEIVSYDYLWAFSVLIHLPEVVMRDVFAECAKRMGPQSRFYFSYVPEKVDARTGLKQFRHTLAAYKDACASAGLSFTDVPWPHQQRIALAQLC